MYRSGAARRLLRACLLPAATVAAVLWTGGCRAAVDAGGSGAPFTSAAGTGPASAGGTGPPTRCLSGDARLAYRPGDPPVGLLCVRPATDLTLVLLPRPGQRWVALRSSDDRLRPYGWTAAHDGAAEVSVHCGRRGRGRLTAVAMWRSGRETAALTLHVLILPRSRRAEDPFLASR